MTALRIAVVLAVWWLFASAILTPLIGAWIARGMRHD